MFCVGQPQSLDCLAVVLPVKLDGEPVSALLDSGAGPSVVDLQTVRNLGLETRMRNIRPVLMVILFQLHTKSI